MPWEPKDRPLNLRITKTEEASYQQAAGSMSAKVSEWVRKILNREVERDNKPKGK